MTDIPGIPAAVEEPAPGPPTGPPSEPLRTTDERVWFLPGDIADLTMVNEITGETEVIRGLCIRPRGAGMGWVLADGSRIPLRPRTVDTIAIVYPEAHRTVEHLTHPDPEDDPGAGDEPENTPQPEHTPPEEPDAHSS